MGSPAQPAWVGAAVCAGCHKEQVDRWRVSDHALAYALILDMQGETEAAIEYLEDSLDRFGDKPDLLAALINIYQRARRRPQAAELLIRRLRNRSGNGLH